MSDTEQSGSVPHTFRLRMAWQWVPKMPIELRRRKAFINALHTVAALADTAGRTRFQDNGRPIRITQLAAAMGSREKDARRYLAAAIAAGLITTEAPARRGRTTVYVLLVPPGTPRWAAALSVLEVGEAPAGEDAEHVRSGAGFGPSAPEPAEHAQPSGSGGEGPNPTAVTGGQVRAARARPSSGAGWVLSSGAGSPNNPGVPMITPHEMVAVGPQVRDARGHDPSQPAAQPPLRSVPPPRSAGPVTGRAAAPRDRQLPLLMPVTPPERPQEHPAHAPADAESPNTPTGRQEPVQPDPSYGPPPMPWRALVAHERPTDAARVYRDRWTGDRAACLPDHATGT